MSRVSGFNAQQEEAVYIRNKHVLVSAPAGSGKTRILVSRILELLKEGVHIDQFLVLTFTQAAAQEMKQRLVGMLEEEISRCDGELKAHLMCQKERLPFAYITNFHGFCNQLVGMYGYLVGVDQGYQILSDNAFLLDQAISATIDEASTDPIFKELRYLYFKDREELHVFFKQLYEMMQAMADREAWLQTLDQEVYGFMARQDQDQAEWIHFPLVRALLKESCYVGLAKLAELKSFCAIHGIDPFYQRPPSQGAGPAKKAVPYEACREYYLILLERLNQAKTLMGSGGINELATLKPASSYLIGWKDLDDQAVSQKEMFGKLKSDAMACFKDRYAELIDTDAPNLQLVFQATHRVVSVFLGKNGWLEKLETRYREMKKTQNVLDFNDLERYATMLLQPEYPVGAALHDQLYEIMVDEYQDTNMIQENLVQLISQAGSDPVRMFMVGDMKQSIYRFRQADPEIFKAKFDQFGEDALTRRIDLVFNYRSNKIVLDSINFLFDQIMDQHVGSLEYWRDPSAQLNYDFLRKEGCRDTAELETKTRQAKERLALQASPLCTEVLLVDEDSERLEEKDEAEYEARLVAKRILELCADERLSFGYGDMAVLMRTTTQFLTYKKVFDAYGIPSSIVLSSGLLSSNEINQLLMVYRIMADPYDDIAMVSVLKAPFLFSGLREETLARWHLKDPEAKFYDLVRQSEDAASHRFTAWYQQSREDLKKMTFLAWNQRFLEESGYLHLVSSQRNGASKKANLLLWLDKIREADLKMQTVEDWLAYFETMSGQSDSPAVTIQNGQSVQFMTIHKSKGLEFPVVFVSMHQKDFNLMDSRSKIILDKNLGMSLKPKKLVDLSTTIFDQPAHLNDVQVEYANPYHRLTSQVQTLEAISEEMRIYYVALTRAGEKLILTGTVTEKKWLEAMSQAVSQMEPDMPETADNQHIIYNRHVRLARNYLDWLLPAIMRHPDVLASLKSGRYLSFDADPAFVAQVSRYAGLLTKLPMTQENLADSHFDLRLYAHQALDTLPEARSVATETAVYLERLPEDSVYPYAQLSETEESIRVTALEESPISYQASNETPSHQSGLTASAKGTLVHAFMEYYPLDETLSLADHIDTLAKEGLYHEEEVAVLKDYLPHLEAFRQSPCYRWLKEADSYYVEQPFVMKQGEQLLHGTLDAFCIQADVIRIIDYKTDRVSTKTSDEELASRHSTQLGLYAEVLQKIYPQHRIEAWLYYLHIDRAVQVVMKC